MGFRGTAAIPNLPTPPTGFAVAAYPTYAQAQAAVEHLVKHDFSVQDVTIVGSDLQMVERVIGRLTAGKLAAAGAAFGAIMGYLGYSVAKGRRDFTSSSQVVARRYDVLCQPRSAEQARELLSRMELGQRG